MFCRQRVIHLFKRKSTGTSIRTNKIALIAGESLKWFTPKLKLVDPARTFANDNAFKEAWCTGSGLDYNIPWSIMESDVAKMPASGCHLTKGAFTSHMRMSRQFQNYSEGIVWAPLIGDKECPDVKACLAMLLPRPVDLSPAVADLFQKFMDAPWISGMREDRPMNTETPKFMASLMIQASGTQELYLAPASQLLSIWGPKDWRHFRTKTADLSTEAIEMLAASDLKLMHVHLKPNSVVFIPHGWCVWRQFGGGSERDIVTWEWHGLLPEHLGNLQNMQGLVNLAAPAVHTFTADQRSQFMIGKSVLKYVGGLKDIPPTDKPAIVTQQPLNDTAAKLDSSPSRSSAQEPLAEPIPGFTPDAKRKGSMEQLSSCESDVGGQECKMVRTAAKAAAKRVCIPAAVNDGAAGANSSSGGATVEQVAAAVEPTTNIAAGREDAKMDTAAAAAPTMEGLVEAVAMPSNSEQKADEVAAVAGLPEPVAMATDKALSSEQEAAEAAAAAALPETVAASEEGEANVKAKAKSNAKGKAKAAAKTNARAKTKARAKTAGAAAEGPPPTKAIAKESPTAAKKLMAKSHEMKQAKAFWDSLK